MRVMPGSADPQSKLIGRRLVARLIDISLFAAIGLFMLALFARAWDDLQGGFEAAILITTTVVTLAYIAYEFIATALTGRTLGKAVTRIEVLRLEPSHSRWRASGMRAVPLFLLIVPGAGWIAAIPIYGYAAVASDGRGMHDLLGSTRVVGRDPILDADDLIVDWPQTD